MVDLARTAGSSKRPFMARLKPLILVVSTLAACWLGMQAVHELGHCLGAWLTGGRIEEIVFDLVGISRTDLAENPYPLVVAWAGPIGGVMIPLGLWLVAVPICPRIAFLFRFFAGFCCVANGLYIGVGSFAAVGDSGDILKNGGQAWQLWLFGTVTAPTGVYLWHDQARYFGLGRQPCHVPSLAVYGALGAALVFVALFLAV